MKDRLPGQPNRPGLFELRRLTILEPRLWDGDDLKDGDSRLVQDLVDHLEVRFDVFFADGFEHFDRDQSVERVFPRFWDTVRGDVTVQPPTRTLTLYAWIDAPPEIHQVHLDGILQPGLSDPLLCEYFLLCTQRQRVHRAPRQLYGFHGHAPPAGSDLEHPMSTLDLGFPDDMMQLGVLSRLERVGRRVGSFRGVRVFQVDRVELVGFEGRGEVTVERGEDGARVGHLAARGRARARAHRRFESAFPFLAPLLGKEAQCRLTSALRKLANIRLLIS